MRRSRRSTTSLAEYLYRADVLRAAEQHGIRPTTRTPPELARGFVRDLYCYELRVLRDRLLRDEFPKHEYAARVTALRDHYRVLSLRPGEWLA
jgi:hypothetical protein